MRRVMTRGEVHEGGMLRISHRERFFRRVTEEFRGEKIVIAVEKETRSLRQNNLLWFWNTMIARELGWTPEEVHEFDKGRIMLCHRTRIDKETGEMIDVAIPRSTHTMPKDEFSEMMETKQRLWAEEGIILPSSDDD